MIPPFLLETQTIIDNIDQDAVNNIVRVLRNLEGRLFVIGVGGSAANASHAVNDFRKIAGIDAYAPTDNVAELTARTNDDGWPSVFEGWLAVANLSYLDALLVLSVGGGSKNVSRPLCNAIDLARARGARVLGIVGEQGGYTLKQGHQVVVVPSGSTPQVEAMQGVLLHAIVEALR